MLPHVCVCVWGHPLRHDQSTYHGQYVMSLTNSFFFLFGGVFVLFCLFPHVGMLIHLHRYCASNNGFCEIRSIMILACLEDTALVHSSPTSISRPFHLSIFRESNIGRSLRKEFQIYYECSFHCENLGLVEKNKNLQIIFFLQRLFKVIQLTVSKLL